ncbi:MAG: type ISP restriction/modification enzyme [Solirubrobacterales bacterium]
MVRAVDEMLKRDFGLSNGLADTEKTKTKVMFQGKRAEAVFHKVQVLDPAVGTATFLNEIIRLVHQTFEGQEGRWPAYSREELIPRLHGFELMMAPYTVAHLKLELTLRESGVTDLGTRLGVYLTNTLEEASDQPQTLFQFGLADVVAQEAIEAGAIKGERPIVVVIGNPPYRGLSSNETKFANSLVDAYKVESGGQSKLQERKHWLNDDYVKFIAFAEAMIKKNGAGIVAMITNHGYLDNPTFRGMRWRLSQTFDAIYVLDLHGNTKKKEMAPDGSRDQNVFDIQQGVAIIFGVLMDGKKSRRLAQVKHAEVFGSREVKFSRLNSDEVEWQELQPHKPMHYFVPRDIEGESEYARGIAINDLFNITGVGAVTGRDNINIAFSRGEIEERFDFIINHDESEIRRKFSLRDKDARDWTVPSAQNDARENFASDKVVRCAYRPFDRRFTFYSGNSRGVYASPQKKVMKHLLLGENVSLVFGRNIEEKRPYTDIFVTQEIIQHHTLSLKEVNTVAPLYVYHDDGTRSPNFNASTLRELAANITKEFEPEDILDYVYGVLHSPAYRKRFAEFLKSDFPRVPVPSSDQEFLRLRGFGAQLRELHLMRSPKCDQLITTFPVAGSNEVGKVRYEDRRVWINASQYFGDVPEVAWSLYIGGYQPAQKWLKDRKGKTLTSAEIAHYQSIIKTLVETEAIMHQIDV